MEPESAQESVERDQLWASLRQLRPAIEALAAGQWAGTDAELQLILLVSRIVLAELNYRSRLGEELSS